jgi:hypothetical protein
LEKLTLIDSRKPPDQLALDSDLIKFWFVWATLDERMRTNQSTPDWLHPRTNDGSLRHFLEWRWALQNLPRRAFRIDFSYSDTAANRALMVARRMEPRAITDALELSEGELRQRFRAWLEDTIDDLDQFAGVLETTAIAACLRKSFLIGTAELVAAAGCSRTTARRMLHDLTHSEVLIRGEARGHAVYSPASFLYRLGKFTDELKASGKFPSFMELSRYSRSRS